MSKMVDVLKVDVLVIGAGISGLCSAKLLTEKRLNVLVLEARDQVGGRMLTVKHHGHGYTDMGAGYIGPTQNNIIELCEELGLELYTVNEQEKSVINWKGKWSTFKGMLPPIWDPIKLLDLNHISRTLESMAKQVPTAFPWMAAKADKWDSMTVQQFVDSVCWTKYIKDVIKLFVQTTLTAEPHEVSLLFLLWYMNSGGGIESLGSVTGGAQEKKIVGGTQQVCEKLAKSLDGKIKLSTPVIGIEQDDDVATVTDSHGNKYKARYVISAIPQTFLNRINFNPPLPPMKQQLIQRLPMGSVIKTIMFYPATFWREEGLCGCCMSNHGPVAYTLDDTKPDGSNPAIMGFIDADMARNMTDMTVEERKDAIKEFYSKAFKSRGFSYPVDYVEKNWMEEEYLGGVFYMPPGALSKYGRMLRKPIGRVYFAGTETATQWVGYMDGAIQAGKRAAREVLRDLKLIQPGEVWWINGKNISCPPRTYGPSWFEWMLPSVTRLFQFLTALALGYTIYEYNTVFTGWRAVVLYKLFDTA